MKLWEKIALGGGIVGLVTIVAAKSAGAQATAPVSGLPPGPYTRLATGTPVRPGGTYLISAVIPAGSLFTAADVISQSKSLGYTILGSWNGAPPGWPTGDPFPTGYHIAVKNPIGTVTTVDAGVAVWATGGFTS